MPVPILCWHDVSPRLAPVATRVGPQLFRRQVEALARDGWTTLGSGELAARLREPAAPVAGRSDRQIVLTFDDGYASLAEHAFPVLSDHGMKALVFVITDFVGGENAWDLPLAGRLRHLGWDDLARWQERGLEVHSHSATHPRLTWRGDDEVTAELMRSRATIRSRLGREPAVVCYPFGAVDRRIARLASAAGYTLGMTGHRGSVASDPMRQGRLMVYPWDRAAPPLVMREGVGGSLVRAAAMATSVLAVGTALLTRGRPE
jgi:peptidoglycan/xylan/chitin deacetylase (PgdA/CDA1 family)